MKFPIGLQPYSIRDMLNEDYFGSIKQVAAIGYKGIEIGMPPEGITIDEQKQFLDELGLQVTGCHAGLEQLTGNLDSLIDYLHIMGGRYVVLSHRFDTKQDVLESAKLFNQIGLNCRKRDIQFLYHNHDWEFVRFDGEYALDLLLQATDPDLVKMELDTYWVKKGGEDPAAYIRKLKNRCPVLHIKDMEPGEEQFFAEVGEGILDFHAIAQAAEEAGTEWLIVEQDHCRRSPMACIETSYRNLVGMGLV